MCQISIYLFIDLLIYNLNEDDDSSDIILAKYREKKSKILNFIDITVCSMSNWDFKAHFRLSRTTVEVIMHSIMYYLYIVFFF